MEKFAKDLLDHLHAELQEVTVMSSNNLQQFERSYHIAESKVKRLKEFLYSYSFKSSEEEIKFFKEINPQFYKEVIYFIELFNIEGDKPVASGDDQRQYYKRVLKRLLNFFDQYRDLYKCHLSGKDDQDHVYYLRSEIKIPLRPMFVLDFDRTITTPTSVVLAYLQAYEQLCIYINNILASHDSEQEGLINLAPKNKLIWTAAKIDLLELAIALFYSGSVNYGKGSLSSFVSALEIVFNIHLGNISRTMTSMAIRKKEQSPFINNLGATFKRKIDERLM